MFKNKSTFYTTFYKILQLQLNKGLGTLYIFIPTFNYNKLMINDSVSETTDGLRAHINYGPAS